MCGGIRRVLVSNFQVLCSSSTKVADRELCLYFGNDAVDHEYRGFAPVMGRWSQSGRCFVGEGVAVCCVVGPKDPTSRAKP